VIWFAIAIPKVVDTRYVHSSDGWIARDDVRPGGWYLQTALQHAHRFRAEEKAQSAALLVGGALPEYIGKMVVVKVEKVGPGWRRVKCTASK